MPNKVVVVQITHQYPFGGCSQFSEPRTTVYAKKKIQHGIQPRFVMKEKIRMLKNLGFQHLVGLQSTTEDEQGFILSYQYVPNKFQPYMRAGNDQIVSKIQKELAQLVENIAAHSIEHQFKLSNIGLDKRNNLKYYIGFDFKIDRALTKNQTTLKYKQQIEKLLSKESNNKEQSIAQAYRITERVSCFDKIEPTWKITPAFDNRTEMGRLMKKSTCIDGKSSKVQYCTTQKAQNRVTLNYDSQINLPEPNKTKLANKGPEDIKIGQMDDLGSRINKLKSFMKEVTRKTPTNTTAIAQFSVKMENNKLENKTTVIDKLSIPTNTNTLQKKLSQFRQSKLTKTYLEKVTQETNVQSSQTNKPQTTTKLAINDNTIGSFSNPTIQKEVKSLLKTCDMKKTKQFAKVQLDNRSSQVPTQCTSNSQQQIPDKKLGHQKTINSTDSIGGIGQQRQHKQYINLATNDRYCQQFMMFLQQSPPIVESGLSSSLVRQQNALDRKSRDLSEYSCKRKQRIKTSQNVQTVHTDETLEIQDRVKKAISNSLKLIGGLKARETFRCE